MYQAVFWGKRTWRAYARCHAARAKLTAQCTLNMLAAAACARAAAQQGMAGKRTETWDATITLRSWPGRDGHGTS